MHTYIQHRLCGAHAAKCSHDGGCTRRVVAKGFCSQHGGGTKCRHGSGTCMTPAHKHGLCSAHGDGLETKCKHPSGCVRYRQVKGLCKSHARMERSTTNADDATRASPTSLVGVVGGIAEGVSSLVGVGGVANGLSS
jgi:hypothetical protein